MKFVVLGYKRCPTCGIRLAANTPACYACGRDVGRLSCLRACWLEFLIVAVLIGLMVILLMRIVSELSLPRYPEPPVIVPQRRE